MPRGSKYECVAPRAYPPVLVTAGLHDPRVPFWEAAKWVARLRANQTAPDHPILLSIDTGAGHTGTGSRFQALLRATSTTPQA